MGTLVPHEGGPGYSTTGSGSSYVQMAGDLLRRRNLLLVDQRGTGRSQPVRCPEMQRYTADFAEATGRCGRHLGRQADDYATTRSADDLAAVLEALELADVDLYGDSYGSFFAQVFAGRHPGLLRSVVLDGAYPTYGENAWYPTQAPAARRGLDAVCRRSTECRRAGRPFLPVFRRVLAQVREQPWRGWSHDADGRRTRVRIDPEALVSVVFAAAYTPAFYRELTAALRSGLRRDRVPLLRLVAEALGGSPDYGPARDYSGGLEVAVSCHDYPYPYDMTLPPGAARQRDYARALRRRARERPRTYAPFTVHEYAGSEWQGLDWCKNWPTAPRANPAGPVRPPAPYADLPVLVLAGELDSLTTPAEAQIVEGQFPGARLVVVRNSFHITALGDTDRCAVRLVRAFVRHPDSQPDADRRGCARDVEPIRAQGVFPVRLSDVAVGSGEPGAGRARRRAAVTAAGTVADLMDRWWNNYSGHGVGLRGGTWTYRGLRVVDFELDGVRMVRDLTVSGQATWDRYRETARVTLQLRGAVTGRLRGRWDTRSVGATTMLHGRLGAEPVRIRLPAP